VAASTPLEPEVRELLTARNMAHVSTLMSDGAPHVSPVWIEVLDDDRALEIMDSMSRRYTGADFPVRSSIVMVIDPERVRLQQLPFSH
jgi:hypothetical protein